jgi:hypothetical protein
MPKTVQIRDIDDQVYAALQRHAAEAGLSVPELLRREVERIAVRPSVGEWLGRTRHGPASPLSSRDVIEALDELRGPWPDARR